jgi:amidase
MEWEKISERKKDDLEASLSRVLSPWTKISLEDRCNVTGIPSELLPQSTIDITEQPAESLVSELAFGRLTSVEVTQAFLLRAKLASQLVCCVTELLPEAALERATFLDEHLRQTGKPIGPLHGLPISVKEHMSIAGLDCNAGFIAWAGRMATANATMADLLLEAGCVLYARTTEPQGLMHLETSSNIYGVTSNPYNVHLTAGGSSGGEGALIALKGSCLGVGSDIGGSIRVPAAYGGLFGFKPTPYRLPLKGFVAVEAGPHHVVPVAGPLSTSLEGINLFMKAVVDRTSVLDADEPLAKQPWRMPSPLPERQTDRRIRVGIMVSDGVVRPHPPLIRALEHLRRRLSECPEFEIFDFPPHDHQRAWRLASGCYFPDGGKRYIETIEASQEPIRSLTDFIINQNPYVKERNEEEMSTLVTELEAYKKEYQAHWNACFGCPERGDSHGNGQDPLSQHLDILLTQVTPGCAPKHGHTRYWSYTAQWNVIGYPCLVFPTGLHVDSSDTPDDSYKPLNAMDAYNQSLCK